MSKANAMWVSFKRRQPLSKKIRKTILCQMKQRINFIPVFILMITISGCSGLGIFHKVFAPQKWSENYALLEGVTCTSPPMVDGKRDTVGKTGHQIIIELPERKSIHRIVIRDTNIEDLILYRWTGNKWMKATKVIGNSSNTIDIRVEIATDRLRFRIGRTFNDKRIAGAPSPITGKIVGNRVKRGLTVASEIELYGFVSKSAKKQKSEEEFLF